MAETIEDSDFTSAQKRVRDLAAQHGNGAVAGLASPKSVDGVTSDVGDSRGSVCGNVDAGRVPSGTASQLAPVELQEHSGTPGPDATRERTRCSNRGFLSMSTVEYLTLLDWTARQQRADKAGSTPDEFAPLFERLGISAETWCELVRNFGRLFSVVAGKPTNVDSHSSRSGSHRYRSKRTARELMTTACALQSQTHRRPIHHRTCRAVMCPGSFY